MGLSFDKYGAAGQEDFYYKNQLVKPKANCYMLVCILDYGVIRAVWSDNHVRMADYSHMYYLEVSLCKHY